MKERSRRYLEKDKLSDPQVVCSIKRGGTSTSKIMTDGTRLAKKKRVADREKTS